jgi:hypothetical protein
MSDAVVNEFTGKEDSVPADTSNEPIIGSPVFLGQAFVLRRFSNFLPIPTSTGNFQEMPIFAG